MRSASVELRAVDDERGRLVAKRLWQLYRHDLSEFRGTVPDEVCEFPTTRFEGYLGDPDRRCYLAYLEERPVGLALVRGLLTPPLVLGEFFVVRALRGRGLWRDLAVAVTELYPGTSHVAFQEANAAAARFWRRLAAELGGSYSEEHLAVPGKPDLQPDVWIRFTASAAR